MRPLRFWFTVTPAMASVMVMAAVLTLDFQPLYGRSWGASREEELRVHLLSCCAVLRGAGNTTVADAPPAAFHAKQSLTTHLNL
jgi:hypothetical protein